jgi:hypothetical protein
MKSVSQYAFSWLIGILVFVLVCAGISKFLPRPVSWISLKVQRFTEKKDDIDIIFVGSSRVYHGIDPKVFDQTLLASGHRSQSFNVAVDGMITAEGFAIVRRLLALHPRGLKYVFFEAQTEAPSVIAAATPTAGQKVKERDIYWRDWESLLSSFRMFAVGLSWPKGALPGAPFSLRRWNDFWPLLSANVRLWMQNATNVGTGLEILRGAIDALPPRPPPSQQESNEASLPSKWDGYYAMSKPMSGETLTTYRKAFASVQDRPIRRVASPMMRGELKRFVQEIAAKKIEVVFVIPPSLKGGRGSGINVPSDSRLFAYDDFVRYPRFYDEENRLDVEHLNGRGAELFSRILAQDFARSLDSPVR